MRWWLFSTQTLRLSFATRDGSTHSCAPRSPHSRSPARGARANNRLKLAAGGGLVADWRPRSPAAAYPERSADMERIKHVALQEAQTHGARRLGRRRVGSR